MDIYSKNAYPSNYLSNFFPHAFVLDGIQCNSMEGFLQSLKYRSQKKQKKICLLHGGEAKDAGSHKILWKLTNAICWNGVRMKRTGPEYQALLDRAYNALCENPNFRQALISTKNDPLTHEIGKDDPRQTILTKDEFLSRLLRLREELLRNER